MNKLPPFIGKPTSFKPTEPDIPRLMQALRELDELPQMGTKGHWAYKQEDKMGKPIILGIPWALGWGAKRDKPSLPKV